MDKVCVHGERRRTGAPVLLELQPDSLTPDWLASVLLMVMVMVMRLRATYYFLGANEDDNDNGNEQWLERVERPRNIAQRLCTMHRQIHDHIWSAPEANPISMTYSTISAPY